MRTFCKRLLVLLLGVFLAAGPLAMAACGPTEEEPVAKSEYTVIYDLNYDGAESRTVTVAAGTRATNWKPTRSGYTFVAWYLDAACTEGNEFNFGNYINEDITIYALWEKDAARYTVTFDLNYDGAAAPIAVSVTENSLIGEAQLPSCPRLGMEFGGWYRDAGCTDEWDLASDRVTGNVTLYASYVPDDSVPRDEDGNVVYNNVDVTVWVNSDFFGLNGYLQTAVAQFNAAYDGEIHITLTTDLVQSEAGVRIQQQPGINVTNSTYYSVSDIYDFAGIEYSASDWYAQAARDSYVNGALYSVPLAASVPYFVYNKELMQEYNGSDPLPSSYSELSALLAEVYAGESTSDPDFRTVVTNRSWTFKEATSYVAFIQNDADYYVYENGAYVNKWSDPAVYANALTALTNTYNLFGDYGADKGISSGFDEEYYDTNAISRVQAGTAFMGLINIGGSTSRVYSNSNLAVLPLSGLFADGDKAQADQIPVHTIGVQFYKEATNVSLTEYAAGAVFADWLTENCLNFARAGWYPLRKSLAESDDFQNSTNSVIRLLLQAGDPENFRTLDGYVNGKSIFNTTAAETYIVPLLDLEPQEAELEATLTNMMYSIQGQL